MTSHSEPSVSVVIPSYRRAGRIEASVRSALGQTLTDLEVVVVDDGSHDGTDAVVNAIDDPRVRLISHETNRGGNAARRTGIAASRGRYVAFLDSDDVWRPEKLRKQVDRLAEMGPGYGFSYTWYDVDSGQGPVPTSRRPRFEGLALPELVATNVIGSFSCVIAERSALELVGGPDASMTSCQDWELYLRLNAVTGVCVVPEPLMIYSQAGGDAHRISAQKRSVLSGHRRVYDIVRGRWDELSPALIEESQRYFMGIYAGQASTASVLSVAKDTPARRLTPAWGAYVATMVARSVVKGLSA